MPFDFNQIIKDLITIGVLFFIFMIFYSKIKKQTMKESLQGVKELVDKKEE